jgi:putative glutamine amidotransferase
MNRPLIGVPTQTLQAIDGIPKGLPHSWVMNHRYFRALSSVGAVPFMVPLLVGEDDTLRAMYDELDGLFLAGGVDVDPESYGCGKGELCGTTDAARDGVELLFAKWALEDGKPLFGVCRGMQVINVAAGGTLYQDTTAHYPNAIKHDYFPTAGYERDYLAHAARVTRDTRLHRIFEAEQIQVNSMHHQGIDALGAGLTSTAVAPDGLIEAIEGVDPNAFIVGVQWHPEMLLDQDAGTRRLFEAFIDASVTHRAERLALR